MFCYKLNIVSQYFDFSLAKSFIPASFKSYFLAVLFLKEQKVETRFCIDYKK